MHIPVYSIILPIRNERESLPELFTELARAMQGKWYEIIAVDDASTDGSRRVLKTFATHMPLRVIRFPTRLGKWTALRAGIAIARGQIIITMDADLQDDPKDISKLVKKLNEGYDVVSGFRKNRQDAPYKIILTKFANVVVSLLTTYRFQDFSSSMKMYRKTALADLPKEGSLLRYSLLFARKSTLRVKEIAVTHRKRLYGVSKFGFVKYIRIFYDLFLILLLFSGSGRVRKTI